MRWIKRIFAYMLLAIIVGALAFFVWAETPLGPMPEALAALESDANVVVSVAEWITFEPASVIPTTGFIFYPGGRVDPRSYAPAAREIARQGYLAVIVDMPLNLAVFDPDRASQVIASHPEISNWAIGGHSLGGSMAASFAADPMNGVEGLVLWASYPTSNTDLSGLQVSVASIFGSEDGLVSAEEIETSVSLLPTTTVWIKINGGNHGQFGWYGDQRGDNPAMISREEQQFQAVQGTIGVLEWIQE
jgi:hypothetical protein